MTIEFFNPPRLILHCCWAGLKCSQNGKVVLGLYGSLGPPMPELTVLDHCGVALDNHMKH
jgi:hypothetical protein